METTASIIAVAQLCEKVVKYIIAVSGAKEEKQRLRLRVRACHALLLQLRDDVADSDEVEEWSKTLKLLSSPLARLQEALSLAAVALSARDGIGEKLRWPFKEKDVEKLIEAIKCEMAMVSLALEGNATSLLIEINACSKRNEQHLVDVKNALEIRTKETHFTLRSINGELETIQTAQNNVRVKVEELHGRQDTEKILRKRQQILDWLTPIDHASEQRDAISRRQPGTGGWLLHSQAYQDWLNADSRTLFCPGIPGAGKTVFASIINADLWERYHQDPTVGLAHLFCNYRRHNEQTLEALLSSLLKQLVEQQVPLPEHIDDLHKKQQSKGASDRTRATVEVLKLVVATYARVFIVVDALDECSTSHGCRTGLLSNIQSLQKQFHINILATSRFIPEITEKFESFETACQLEIQADSNDVRRYLSENMYRLPGFVQSNKCLQEEVSSKIVEAVRGMFLLAKLHLDSLIGKRAPKAVRIALNKLATGSEAYDSAYDAAMERIEGQVADQEELAKQTLALLTCAQRPLSAKELQAALGVEVGDPEFDPDNCPDIKDILASCLGLVTKDEDSGIIRLVHYTTQEYLERTHDRWFPEAQTMMADVCTSYLSLDRYADSDLWNHLEDSDWYYYSAQYWHYHAHLAPSCLHRVVSFLTRQTNVKRCGTSWAHSTIAIPNSNEHLYSLQDIYSTGLHVAILHNLEDAAVALIEQELDLESRDERGQTPLILAALLGNQNLVEKLVEANCLLDARVEEPDGYPGFTALHWAARFGRISIVKFLLNSGAAVDSKDGWDSTPLFHSLYLGDLDEDVSIAIVKLLLDAGANVNLQDFWGNYPYQVAVRRGSFKTAQFLLERGANPELGLPDRPDSAMGPSDQTVPKGPGKAERLMWLDWGDGDDM